MRFVPPGIGTDGVQSRDPCPGSAVLTAADRLAEIADVGRKLAEAIIAETVLDMTRFRTALSAARSPCRDRSVARRSEPKTRKPKGTGAMPP